MKEIGSKFKEKREEIGMSLVEVARDLDVTIPQLENLEDGNSNAFKDVFFLKDLIIKYAKYLNVDEEEVTNEFNDFVFNLTSKIPVNEIEEKIKEIEKVEEEQVRKTISSPYTRKKVMHAKFKPVYLYTIITIILCMITLIIANTIASNRTSKPNTISYIIGGE